MQLFVSAQDIRSITYAVLEGGEIVHQQILDAPPEAYLRALDTILQRWELTPAVFREVLVVTGPGSFTASRVSTTIANTVAFVHKIPIRGFENPEQLPLGVLISSFLSQADEYVTASYDRPANITTSRPKNGDKKRD